MRARQYVLDENVDHAVRAGLHQQWPEIVVWVVGDPGAPQLGTPDPDILVWCEERGFSLVTYNRASMPRHLQAHLAVGRHVSGVFILNRTMTIGAIVEELALIWGASEPDEYSDQVRYVPLTS